MEDAGDGMPSAWLPGMLAPAWGEAGSETADGVRGSVSRRTRPCDCCAALAVPRCCTPLCCGVCCGAEGLPRAGCPLVGRGTGVGCCMRALMPLAAL